MKAWNSQEMERRTGITIDRVAYAVRKGRLGEYTRVRGAYVFFEDDLKRIVEHFGDRKPWQRTLRLTSENGEVSE
jgi:hypothetical protein